MIETGHTQDEERHTQQTNSLNASLPGTITPFNTSLPGIIRYRDSGVCDVITVDGSPMPCVVDTLERVVRVGDTQLAYVIPPSALCVYVYSSLDLTGVVGCNSLIFRFHALIFRVHPNRAILFSFSFTVFF